MAERILRQKTGDLNNKKAKRKAMWRFPIFRTDKPSFLRGINEESESRYKVLQFKYS